MNAHARTCAHARILAVTAALALSGAVTTLAQAQTCWTNSTIRSPGLMTDFAGTYFINSAADFGAFAYLVNQGNNFAGATVKLTTDINLSAHWWAPIGIMGRLAQGGAALNCPFSGTFDGQGHTISGLRVGGHDGNPGKGLFGVVMGDGGFDIEDGKLTGPAVAVIRDVNIVVQEMTAYDVRQWSYLATWQDEVLSEEWTSTGMVYMGGLAGVVSLTRVEGVTVSGDNLLCVGGRNEDMTMMSFGGLVGMSAMSSFSGCTNQANVKGVSVNNILPQPLKLCFEDVVIASGGMVGTVMNVWMTGCANYGNVFWSDTLPDLPFPAVIDKSLDRMIWGMGGIAGFVMHEAVLFANGCVNEGIISRDNSALAAIGIGGIVGYGEATLILDNCHNRNTVQTGVFDLMGNNIALTPGAITLGGIYGGGVAGFSEYYDFATFIVNCSSTGKVDGGQSTGGIVGALNNGDLGLHLIANCWNSGNVSGAGLGVIKVCAGGIAGSLLAPFPGASTVQNCYSAGTVLGAIHGANGSFIGQATATFMTHCFWPAGSTPFDRVWGPADPELQLTDCGTFTPPSANAPQGGNVTYTCQNGITQGFLQALNGYALNSDTGAYHGMWR